MNASKEATQSLWMQQEVAADAPRLARRRLESGGWALVRGAGHVWSLPLDDGRRLVVRPQHPREGLHSHLLIAALGIVLAFVLGGLPDRPALDAPPRAFAERCRAAR